MGNLAKHMRFEISVRSCCFHWQLAEVWREHLIPSLNKPRDECLTTYIWCYISISWIDSSAIECLCSVCFILSFQSFNGVDLGLTIKYIKKDLSWIKVH